MKRGLVSSSPEMRTARDVMRRLLFGELGADVAPERVQSVKHHRAHAMSA